jgi:hypothetical protein
MGGWIDGWKMKRQTDGQIYRWRNGEDRWIDKQKN